MAISGAENDPLALISDVDSGLDDEYFSDDEGHETDYISVCDDDVDKDDLINNDDDWLCNEKEHSSEHYLEEKVNLNPSSLQQYCKFVKWNPAEAYDALTIQSLERFSQLGLVYKCEANKKIDEMIIRQAQDLLKLIADEKLLSRQKREKATMYVQDLVEYCRLAGYTGNRPEALLNLRYRHLQLTLVRDPGSEHPRLVIELTAEFTKGFLGMKDANTFPLPEVIYDPTLILSPHVLLLGMLFHIKAFQSPNIDCPENLYSLNVLPGLNEQRLPLREELANKYVFCEAIQQGEVVRLALDLKYSYGKLKYRMKKGGEITGFFQIVKPYVLRNGAAKAYNKSPDVSEPLQNLILQHSRIDTLLKHYLDRNITADVLSIYRGLEPQKAIMDMLCSMSRSIDPRRPASQNKQDSSQILKSAPQAGHWLSARPLPPLRNTTSSKRVERRVGEKESKGLYEI
ncbi:hypothetical protein LOZ12_002725 [Ophidiomyces ophidiicola]|uniref:uncharacterized protein n=1 Tax=Ophidiomyces ophidiicola TaxID=1387563 RepID=UPI0020C52B85|nr:uncharacterized protein LOZ57_004769 [Ophidiomyces ophidiicola]KAI1913309.1 hypothetical protein LOZ61_002845 [Ophidiomyces ophidiicola]KAI1921556.1 hypothetical protein LOZ64_001538 [Ophidiomyces ophidiicola]KAI1944411.1 hypothetical protein LOZ57_004769 [Ophidiomyces ophidiicola]KAI1949002.1 hypothetical protein LOZ62_002370 [Ophidiomyces ophidiicola]KAI1958701.1 hypothetical protein LOZ59_003385 [Ophidiomyces ophidiicola]